MKLKGCFESTPIAGFLLSHSGSSRLSLTPLPGILIMEEIRRVGMAEIKLHEGESIENALRRFKRKVMQEDIIKEVKKHSFYLKPGEKKRIKQALARKRSRKKVRREPLEERK
jgi:small subunit ribosomal protein S21